MYDLRGLVQFLGSSQVVLVVKNPPDNAREQEMWVWSLHWEGTLEEGMATSSSTLAWRIPRTEEPGGLQSIGLQRVGHDWSNLAHMPMGSLYSKKKKKKKIELDRVKAGIKITGRNINNLTYADDITLMAESEEELKRLLKVKEGSEKAGLKLNIQKTKIMAFGPITSWQIDGIKYGNSDRLYFLGLQNHCVQWL